MQRSRFGPSPKRLTPAAAGSRTKCAPVAAADSPLMRQGDRRPRRRSGGIKRCPCSTLRPPAQVRLILRKLSGARAFLSGWPDEENFAHWGHSCRRAAGMTRWLIAATTARRSTQGKWGLRPKSFLIPCAPPPYGFERNQPAPVPPVLDVAQRLTYCEREVLG